MTDKSGISLTLNEGHFVLMAEVLRIERDLEKAPIGDAIMLLKQAVNNLKAKSESER